MRITDTHVYFYGNGDCFSNWHPCKFTINGYSFSVPKNFNSSEQAYMYLKARCFSDAETSSKILDTPSAKEAKQFGREVKNFNPLIWDQIKSGVMILVNYFKYLENSAEREILLKTGDKILVEASPDDKIWGVGLSQDNDSILDESKWLGQNLLGKALMDVRTLLKK